MKTIQIYLHGENSRESKLVDIATDATIKDIIKMFQKTMHPEANDDEIELFLQDEETPKVKGKRSDEEGISKRQHIHCHRCRKIAVTVEYNGQLKNIEVPPSYSGKNLLKKAAKEFNITEKDAADLILKLPDGNVLQPTDHIGSFVAFPKCEIKLLLIHNVQVQG